MTWTQYPENKDAYGFRMDTDETAFGLPIALELKYIVVAESERDATLCAYLHASLDCKHLGLDVPWMRMREE